ncbi:hypothetical protein OF83DRAFT_1140840 [Amylostereum chailletii]|nr:hypothetical protein OF83DRAFT_1140840 [Amylostereum chailletii]
MVRLCFLMVGLAHCSTSGCVVAMFTSLMELLQAASDSRIKGEKHLMEGRLDEARRHFMIGFRMLVGDDVEVPLGAIGGGIRSERYITLPGTDAIAEVMGCCLGVGLVLKGQGKWSEALMWFEEVRTIHKNLFLGQKTAFFEWTMSDPSDKDYWQSRILSMLYTTEISLHLGNTGMATHQTWNAFTQVAAITDEASLEIRRYLEQILPSESRKMEIINYKHPDPKLSASSKVEDPTLQVMGSWEKVWMPKTAKIQPRYGFASFIWNGRFYVCGGERTSERGPYFRDLQYIDLQSLDTGWHSLPPCPAPPREPSRRLTGHGAWVHDDKAYVFSGQRILDVFDLKQETWGRVKTRWEDDSPWPSPLNDLTGFAVVYVLGKLYVFGGAHRTCVVGCDLWMVLDMRTGVWRRLSGSTGPRLRPNFETPGPRKAPMMWVDRQKEHIWLLYGEADRWTARRVRQELDAHISYIYEDCWSWNIAAETWTRVRVVGNAPCPRSEASAVYNPVLDRTIVFGGTNMSNPGTIELVPVSLFEANNWYADTFLLEPAPKNAPNVHPVWRHVLTRGFPTYRGQAHMFVDPDTGRTFVFGGYNRTKHSVNNGAGVERAFGDLWTLRVDVPGGGIEEADLEEDARNARTGPWLRCFTCAASGSWKRCGGSCGGASFFCSPECQKEGWREHKWRYDCTK